MGDVKERGPGSGSGRTFIASRQGHEPRDADLHAAYFFRRRAKKLNFSY